MLREMTAYRNANHASNGNIRRMCITQLQRLVPQVTWVAFYHNISQCKEINNSWRNNWIFKLLNICHDYTVIFDTNQGHAPDSYQHIYILPLMTVLPMQPNYTR